VYNPPRFAFASAADPNPNPNPTEVRDPNSTRAHFDANGSFPNEKAAREWVREVPMERPAESQHSRLVTPSRPDPTSVRAASRSDSTRSNASSVARRMNPAWVIPENRQACLMQLYSSRCIHIEVGTQPSLANAHRYSSTRMIS